MVNRTQRNGKVSITMDEFLAAQTVTIDPTALTISEMMARTGRGYKRMTEIVHEEVLAGRMVRAWKRGSDGRILPAYAAA